MWGQATKYIRISSWANHHHLLVRLQCQPVGHLPLKPFAVSEKYTKYLYQVWYIYTKYHVCVVWARSQLHAVWDMKVTEDRVALTRTSVWRVRGGWRRSTYLNKKNTYL